MTKKILFISYDGMTDPLGQSQVIPYLQGLTASGYTFFLLSCEKNEVFEKNREVVEGLLKDFPIEWIPLTYTKKPPVLSTLIDIIKLRRAAKKVHQENGLDMVHTRPGIPALIGTWLKQKYRIPFLNDIREFYADSRVDGGMWNKENFLYGKIYRYFKKQESLQVKLSDGIVCLTYAAEKIIQNWPEYNREIPLTVIPCSVDLALFDPAIINQAELEESKQQLGIKPGDFIISYLGSIGGWYLTAEMMMFCKRVSEQIPQARFLFISPHRHQLITDTAEKYGLAAAKIITTHATRKQVPGLLSLSNFAVFFIRPCYSKLSSSPTKHGEIMAMGIPVITNSGVGDVKAIVEKYEAGFVIDDFSESTFDRVITEIKNGRNFNPAGIRDGSTDFYSLQQAIDKYATIYKQVLGKH